MQKVYSVALVPKVVVNGESYPEGGFLAIWNWLNQRALFGCE
ncbi:hypothetical protein [Amazonocrinis nigriterrae]|nr:hypothetical protein [Amazonocrinis nigriterrae]